MAKQVFEFSKLNRGRFNKRFTENQLDTVNIDRDGIVSMNYDSSEVRERIMAICSKYASVTRNKEVSNAIS